MLWPKLAGKYIASKAKDVKIIQNGIEKCSILIANAVKEGNLTMEAFKQSQILPLDLSKHQLSNLVFLLDALNFNFWTPNGVPKYTVTYNGKTHTGYMAMVLAVTRAVDSGKPLYSPHFYSKLTLNDMELLFLSDSVSTMPLLEKRVEVSREIGNILLQKFEGDFLNVVKLANGSAINLVKIVTMEFPCFRDIHSYEGEEVALFKRAQILAADLAVLYEGKECGNFYDLDELTMFADYRVPQTLVHFGVISYSDSLMKKLKEEHLFKSGDREEVEIRGVSIHATELLVEETKKLLMQWNVSDAHINSFKVDFFLWNYRYMNSDILELVPYHRTRCIYY